MSASTGREWIGIVDQRCRLSSKVEIVEYRVFEDGTAAGKVIVYMVLTTKQVRIH